MDLLGRIREDMAFESNIWKSYAYRFLMEFQLWLPIWIVYLQQQRGLSLTKITLLDLPFFVLMVFAEVPTGAVADRFGRRWSLMLGSSLFAVAVFIFGVADNYTIILLSYTAWGLALTFQSGADAALLYDSLKHLDREEDFQRINSRLWALRSGAAVCALLIGAPVAAMTDFSSVIIFSAIVAALATPIAFSMHEAKRDHDEAHDPYFQTLFGGLREVWDQPSLRYIILYAGIISAAAFAPMVFQQPFLSHHGVSVGGLGFWQAPVRGAGIVSALLAHRFLASSGQRGAFFAMPVALTLASLAVAGIDHAWVFVAFLGMGVVAGAQNPLLATYINRRIPSERRATILSVQSLIGNLIFASIWPLNGMMADAFGLRALFLMFAVLTAVFGITSIALWSRAEDRERAEMDELNRALLGREREAIAV